ncbi:BRCA1 C terminus domain-containing protein [Xylariaceae sp. FL1272]|nr:BRCA1 C terminus domain-containing protein [Xylariaceae sp. FL1272]
MPSPSKQPITKAAEPKFGQSFDPWNSSSTGHQRAENRLGASTGWRDSRNKKLMGQYTGGAGGGKRISDTVGAGSEDYDAQAKALITPEVRSRGQKSVYDMLSKPGTMKEQSIPSSRTASSHQSSTTWNGRSSIPPPKNSPITVNEEIKANVEEGETTSSSSIQGRRLFEGVVVYVNGSTYPHISDHKLKHLLAGNGGQMSSHLGRKKVTHVILGRHAGSTYGSGSGGGLTAGKLQREIQQVSGSAVKYVNVDWVLESLKAGKRLPEAKFSELKIASAKQNSVYGLYSNKAEIIPGAADAKLRSRKRQFDAVDDCLPPPSAQPSAQDD